MALGVEVLKEVRVTQSDRQTLDEVAPILRGMDFFPRLSIGCEDERLGGVLKSSQWASFYNAVSLISAHDNHRRLHYVAVMFPLARNAVFVTGNGSPTWSFHCREAENMG